MDPTVWRSAPTGYRGPTVSSSNTPRPTTSAIPATPTAPRGKPGAGHAGLYIKIHAFLFKSQSSLLVSILWLRCFYAVKSRLKALDTRRLPPEHHKQKKKKEKEKKRERMT